MIETSQFCNRPALRHSWYAVARTPDLARDPLAVTLLGDPYVLWRAEDGAVVAAPDRCPHREAPLSLGRLTDGQLGVRVPRLDVRVRRPLRARAVGQ